MRKRSKDWKDLFIEDHLTDSLPGREIRVLGWVGTVRDHGSVIFIDLVDSTGAIQLVVEPGAVDAFTVARTICVETSVEAKGLTAAGPDSRLELRVAQLRVISESRGDIFPSLRGEMIDRDGRDSVDFLLQHRHLYLRNPRMIAIMRFRDELMASIRSWFRENRFVEISAPVLTKLPLYMDGSAINLNLHGENIYLSQCVGFYLEAAAQALERVYSLGPSFRAEESRSRRHLIEYWHVKAEIAFGNLEDMISLVEELLAHVAITAGAHRDRLMKRAGLVVEETGELAPFPRITYEEAIGRLKRAGIEKKFGRSIGTQAERFLGKDFSTPFWIVGNPAAIEPFPYALQEGDARLTRTADLIAPCEYGELLGVAEKIVDLPHLEARMADKGADPEVYWWVRQLREFGQVPHIAVGMGLERLIRWLLQLGHVRDTIPFPRIVGRRIDP